MGGVETLLKLLRGGLDAETVRAVMRALAELLKETAAQEVRRVACRGKCSRGSCGARPSAEELQQHWNYAVAVSPCAHLWHLLWLRDARHMRGCDAVCRQAAVHSLQHSCVLCGV